MTNLHRGLNTFTGRGNRSDWVAVTKLYPRSWDIC